MTTGLGDPAEREASWVFRPLPVMQMTVEPSRSILPCSISFWATARVTPPAVSAQIPSVSARSFMASTIASSSTSSLQPPVSPDQLRGEVAVGGVADGQALGDRLRVADRLDLAGAGLDRGRDRVAAGRLGAEHPGA